MWGFWAIGFGGGVELLRRPAHDGEIDFVVAQRVDQCPAVADEKLDVDVRMTLGEPREQFRREIFRRADEADGRLAAAQSLHRAQRLFGILQFAEHARGVMAEQFSGPRQRKLLADALEQRQADRALELANLHRDGRLSQVQRFGGSGEIHVPGRLDEHGQLAQAQSAQHLGFVRWFVIAYCRA